MPDLQPAVLLEMLRAALETGAVAVSLADGATRGRSRVCSAALRRPRRWMCSFGPAGGACGIFSRRSTTVVIDEPTWTALDPERRTLLDVDEPGDIES